VEGEEAAEDGRGTEACVRKVATNSVAIQGQDFTFDAVADAASTQVRPSLRFGVTFCVLNVWLGSYGF
jgi:hypothetical protein